MCTDNAAVTPEFFLHHGMIDKTWADWQSRSDKCKKAYLNVPGKIFNTTCTLQELIDLNKLPGDVRVTYQEAKDSMIVKNYLRGKKWIDSFQNIFLSKCYFCFLFKKL